jgi:hypothetical protein
VTRLALSILALSLTGYLEGEVQTGGLTHQCYYDVAGSTYVLTLSVTEVCPQTVEIPRQ